MVPATATRIHHPFERWARVRPDAAAVVGSDGRTITYGELDRAAGHLAARLIGEGVGPGDRVGVFLRKGCRDGGRILAKLKVDAAWVPQDARISSAAQLQHIVRVAGIDVVLRTEQFATDMAGLARAVLPVDLLASWQRTALRRSGRRARALPRRAIPATETAAVVIFTSGTTGVPNGVEVTHANLVNTILDGPAALGIQPGMRVAQLLNIAFDAAYLLGRSARRRSGRTGRTCACVPTAGRRSPSSAPSQSSCVPCPPTSCAG